MDKLCDTCRQWSDYCRCTNIKTKPMAVQKPCKVCGQYFCVHKDIDARLGPTDFISNGESIGKAIGDRIIMPHSNVIDMKETKTVPAIAVLQTQNIDDDWISCNLCSDRVHMDYLDTHLRVHIETFKPKEAKTSTALTLVKSDDKLTSSTSSPPPSVLKETKPNVKKISISPRERYSFRNFAHSCATSGVSKTGRISDFTLVFWNDDKEVIKSTSYAGGSYTSSNDWERLTIHCVYDNVDRYYTLSAKISKRSTFSSWDNDDSIPDRICEQEELMVEIKRALLFFRVSPKVVYKQFRKMFNQGIDLTYDKDNRVCFAQTVKAGELIEKLKKSSGNSGSNYSGTGYCGPQRGGWEY